jgi:hypothetical protein
MGAEKSIGRDIYLKNPKHRKKSKIKEFLHAILYFDEIYSSNTWRREGLFCSLAASVGMKGGRDDPFGQHREAVALSENSE